MENTLIETLSLAVLVLALIPLGGFIFVYNTRPVAGSRWRRRFVPKWATSVVGWSLMSMVTSLFLLLGYLLLVRFIGDFPGRLIVSFILFVAMMASFWAVFVALMLTQHQFEKNEALQHEGENDGENADHR